MAASKNGLMTQIECEGCGKMQIVSYSTKQKQYCNNACRQAAYRKRQAKRYHRPSLETVISWLNVGVNCFSDELFNHFEQFGEDSTNSCTSMMIAFLQASGLNRNVKRLPHDQVEIQALELLVKRYGNDFVSQNYLTHNQKTETSQNG